VGTVQFIYENKLRQIAKLAPAICPTQSIWQHDFKFNQNYIKATNIYDTNENYIIIFFSKSNYIGDINFNNIIYYKFYQS
jgi:hypothetical protein